MEDRAISLNAVIDVMHEMWGDSGELLDAIKELSPVTPQEPCEDCDCVSRATLISKLEILERRYGSDFYWETRKIVDKLPSVKPQEPKTGHCIDCKYFRKLPYHADILGKCVNHWGFCPKGDWYCADFEPQERSE